jgi:hypothetical protein
MPNATVDRRAKTVDRLNPGLTCVDVEAGLQAGQADLKVGLYINTSELRD